VTDEVKHHRQRSIDDAETTVLGKQFRRYGIKA